MPEEIHRTGTETVVRRVPGMEGERGGFLPETQGECWESVAVAAVLWGGVERVEFIVSVPSAPCRPPGRGGRWGTGS